jgi:diguanylate cyclase (GGDEF)-like protein
MDTSERALGTDALLAGVRRLMLLADSASDPDAIFRALAHELFLAIGGEEVHVHRISEAVAARASAAGGGASAGGASAGEHSSSAAQEDLVVVYMFGGEARMSYLLARSERAPGVSWVASTGKSVLACGARELAASVPRLAVTGGIGCALLLPLRVRGEVEAVVTLARKGVAQLDERATQRAATLVDQAATALALLRARAEAGTDPVTGCMNHRAMRRRLHEEIGRAARSDAHLACLLIDLDNFKLVNDRHGHPAGDTMLREVAQALMGEFRAFDRVARYGGDEFVVILPNADLESAAGAGERALARLRALPSFDITPGVAASIGAAQWHSPMDTDMLLQACDEALLQSKRDGKGRVTRAA